MFELSKDEFNNLRSQIVTSSWGGSRYLPFVFTEQGVAMLSSVLKSDREMLILRGKCTCCGEAVVRAIENEK